MKKRIGLVRILVTSLVMSILMSVVSVTIYNTVAKPEFYDKFMALGNRYLEEEKYEEAVLEFNKAIEIEEKSTEARVGVAKGSIGLDDIDTAVKVLKEAQSIDMENKELLLEMIEILRDADSAAAYELLLNYINRKGQENIDEEIRILLESAEEPPRIPEIFPEPGKYVQPFSVKLISDKVRVGHIFRYTYDGTIPDEESTLYRNGIPVDDDVTINLVGYNPHNDRTDVVELSYTIDTGEKTRLERLVRDARAEMDSTKEGTEVGNCIAGAKEELIPYLEKGEALLAEKIISYDDAKQTNDELEEAWENFKLNIIVPTDRTELEETIEEAEERVGSVDEGNEVGKYRPGSRQMLEDEISTAIAVLENLVARQETIDEATENLVDAMERLETQKIKQEDVIIHQSGAQVGPVTVSLLWDTTDDVDLYVTAPDGETIYFSNTYGRNGGILDVDRQVDSFVEHPVENIYWENAPHGTYTVEVGVYSKRTSGAIPYKVRVISNGETTWYEGTINDGYVTACTFTY